MWEQVQLLGVAGAWVWASAAECGRALPLPVGMSMCQAPGVADVLVATAPPAPPGSLLAVLGQRLGGLG